MIVLYAEKEDMGLKYAAALGGIPYRGVLVNTASLSRYQDEIKKNLSRNQGYIETEFEGKPLIVTWGWGHFGQLKDVRDYHPEWKKWNDCTLPFFPSPFEPRLKVSDNEFFQKRNERQFAIVKDLFNRSDCEYIINGTDWEREGELIFSYLYTLTKTQVPYYRLRSNAKTETQIQKDMKARVDSITNAPFVYAAEARGKADWTIGINLTIAASLSLAPDRKMMNVGRVITPTLAMVVEREDAISAFVPKTSFGVRAEFSTESGESFIGKADLEELFDTEKEAKEFISSLPSDASVAEVKQKDEYSNPLPLHNTSSLQVEANEIYGYTLDQTLGIAQKLYEAGYITYPRVDSQYLTEDKKAELPTLLRKLDTYSAYSGHGYFGNFTVPDSTFDNSKVDGHDAIITTDVIPSNLAEEESNIYDLIARRLMMAVSGRAKKRKVRVRVEVSTDSDPLSFVASETKVMEAGYLAYVLHKKEPKEDKEPASLPAGLEEGMKVSASYQPDERKAKAPERYTDASLIRAMENCGRKVEDATAKALLKKTKGIGRPATRASLLERLIQVEFVSRKGKQLIPTERGMSMIHRFPIEELKSPLLTADWEARLDEIEQQPDPAIAKSMAVSFQQDVEAKTKEWCDSIAEHKVEAAAPSWAIGASCPICGKPVYEGKATNNYPAKYYCSGYKDGCGFSLPQEICQKKISKEQAKKFCENGQSDVISGFRKKGKKGTFSARLIQVDSYRCERCGMSQNGNENNICRKSDCNGHLVLDPHRKGVAFDFDDSWNTKIPCPICGKPVYEGEAKGDLPANYYCSRYKDGCPFRLKKEVAGKSITRQQLKQLLTKGKTNAIQNFRAKNGTLFNACLLLVDVYVCDSCGQLQQNGDHCFKENCKGALSKDPAGRKSIAFQFVKKGV